MALRFFRRASRVNSKSRRRDSSPTQTQERPRGPQPTPSQEDSVRKAREYGESLNATSNNRHAVDPPREPVLKLSPDQQEAVLSDEEERFLERLVSGSEGDTDAADDQQDDNQSSSPADTESPAADKQDEPQPVQRQSWLSLPQSYTLGSWVPSFTTRRKSAEGLPVPATTPKKAAPLKRKAPEPDSPAVEPDAAPTAMQQQERQDVTSLLHRLHLDTDALSHRVVSLSADSKRLLSDFCQLVRDALAGAPHAYDDLEAFFRTRQAEIEALHASLPPFLQTFVAGLPVTLVSKYAPDLAAAAGMGKGGVKDGKGKRADVSTPPPLRSLLGQRGAIASLLRSSVTFLETRFPILLGWSNVLVSLALFVLLFVFWYCWQRGRDERVAKEQVEQFVERAGQIPLDAGDVEAGLAVGDAHPVSTTDAGRGSGDDASPAQTKS